MNLWDDYDNQQALTETVGHKQARRPTEKIILSSLREWLLQDYASVYCRSLAAMRIYRRCFWIDAWGAIDTRTSSPVMSQSQEVQAEKGRQKTTTQATPPIPSILQPVVSLSQALAQGGKPIALNGIVLEVGSSRRKEGRARQNGNHSVEVEASTVLLKDGLKLPKESGIVRASWLEIAPRLLREIEQSPAIFLLNPFGQTLFSYEDLAPLYQRKTAPTELGLLIPHQQAAQHVLSAARSPAGAATLTALLRTDRWKALLPKDEGTAPDLAGVIDLLRSSMQQHFLWVQAITLPLLTGAAVVETAPYTLLFATRSKDSLVSMNDAVCLYHRRLTAQSLQGVLGEAWFVTQQQARFAEELQQLRQRTLHLGKTQRVRRWPDLRQQLLVENFGRFTLHDYDKVMDELLIKGDLRCEWGRGRRPAGQEDQRAPGNEDTLLWK
jgi:hypothetical protein